MRGCAARQRDPAAGARTAGVAPTTLLITIRRSRCTGCGHVSRQDTSRAAEPRAKLSRRALRWALEGIVRQHLTVARVAEGLGVSWNTANDAVLAEGRRVLIEDPHRFDGVRVIGVDEHCWRHTRRGDTYVTVIIDLTPIRDGTGPKPADSVPDYTLDCDEPVRIPRGAHHSPRSDGLDLLAWLAWAGRPWQSRPRGYQPPPRSGTPLPCASSTSHLGRPPTPHIAVARRP
jgi:hypothetical protein